MSRVNNSFITFLKANEAKIPTDSIQRAKFLE